MTRNAKEHAIIEALYAQLIGAERIPFPEARKQLCAPKEKGVYIIFGPNDKVLHVGMTHSAKDGLRQRLRNHLTAHSSFVKRYYSGNARKLRRGHTFLYLIVTTLRQRVLLEALATGKLCPADIGFVGDDARS